MKDARVGRRLWHGVVVVWLCVFASLGCSQAGSSAPADESVEALIERVLTQAGGREAWAALAGVRYRGTFELFDGGDRERFGSHETTIGFPDRLAQRRVFDGGGALIRVLDHDQGSMQIVGEVTPLEPSMVAELRAYIETRYVTVLRSLARGAALEEVSRNASDASRSFEVSTPAGGITIEIDPAQARVVGLTSRLVAMTESETELRQAFSDFRVAGSIEIPHVVESASQGQLYSRRQETSVEVDPALDDQMFRLEVSSPST